MSFWDPQAEEPLRQYRWYLVFSDYQNIYSPIKLNNLKISLKDCSKPEYDISINEHKLLNHTFRYPGIVKWKPITVKFISHINDRSIYDTTQILFDYLYEYSYVESISSITFDRKVFRNNEDTINKISGIDLRATGNSFPSDFNTKKELNIGNIELIQIAGDGYELEKWKLYNCWFSNVNFGSLSYDSEDFVLISATIQYDWAEKGLRKSRPIKDKDNTKPSSAQQTLPAQTASPVPQAQQVDSSSKTVANVPAQQKPVPPATTPAVAQQELPTRQPPSPPLPPLEPFYPPEEPRLTDPPLVRAPDDNALTSYNNPAFPPPSPPLPPLEPFYPPEEPRLTDPPLVRAEDDNTLTSYNNPAFPSNTGTGTGGVTPDGGNRPSGTGTGTTQLSPPPLVRAEDDNTLTSYNNPAFPSNTGTGTGTSSGTGTSTGTGGNRPSGTGTGTNNNRGTGTGNGGNLNRYANSGYPTGENPNKGSDTSSIIVPLDSSSSTPLGYYTIGLNNRRYSFESGTVARVNSAIERYNRSQKTEKDYKEYERSVKQAAEDDAKRNRRIGF